jgi:hypothetical protein
MQIANEAEAKAKVPPWIAPRLRCGLGNRLFQAFAAIGLAERTGSRAVFLLPRMSHHEHGNFDLIRTLCPNTILIETAHEWEEVEETEEKTIPTINTEKPVVLAGFFQNSENFPSLYNFNNPRLPSPAPGRRENTWAIHFRIGDYSILPHHQVPKLAQYYYQTIKTHIPTSNTTLVLISDSPEKLPHIAKELNEMGYKTEIFESEDALETLKTFAACQGGSVCSNSTFAWWGAFFGFTNSKKYGEYRAFFPDVWLTNQPTPNILNQPFTHPVKLSSLPAFPYLQSFSY